MINVQNLDSTERKCFNIEVLVLYKLMYILVYLYGSVYTRDGQHVTSMINEEFGIMPLGTSFGWEDGSGRNLITFFEFLKRTKPYDL